MASFEVFPIYIGPALASYLAMLRYYTVVEKKRITNAKIYVTSSGICLLYIVLYFGFWPYMTNWYEDFRIVHQCVHGYINYNSEMSVPFQLQIFAPIYSGMLVLLYYYTRIYMFIWKNDAKIQ